MIAPFRSASIGPHAGQITVSCRGRAHRARQRWQVKLVPAGLTSTTLRAASSAFPMRMQVNWCQAASRMLLFSPAFAAAWFGRYAPGFSVSGLSAGRLVIPATFSSSSAIMSHSLTSIRAVLWWKLRRRLRTLRHSLASTQRIRFRLPEPGLARDLRRSRSAITSADAARNRGLSTTSPSLAVRKRATPTSTPTSRPVAGSGAGSVSAIRMTYQRRCSRLSWGALTVPRIWRCWRTLN